MSFVPLPTAVSGKVLTSNGVGVEPTFQAGAINKNLIINPDFNIWQRGTSFAAIASQDYFADRFIYAKAGAMVHTVSRSTDVPTVAESGHLSNYSALIDCTTVDTSLAAGDLTLFHQKIEGFTFLAIAQKEFTLSFWVKGTKTGIHCVAFRNSGGDRSYIAEYTINATATWEKKTITVSASPSAGTWNYTNGVGITMSFCLAVGSTFQTTAGTWQTGNFVGTANQVNACDNVANDFRIAQVKVEVGGSATDFRGKSIHDDLQACQRYYTKTFNQGVAPAQNAGLPGALAQSLDVANSISVVSWRFKATMRATPAIILYNPSAANTNWTSGQTSGAFNIGEGGCHIQSSGTGTAGTRNQIHASADAEL